jgi:hypothetical protein
MPPHLLLELLTVTRVYRTCFNIIDIFVCDVEKQNIDYFIKNIYNAIYNRLSPKVDRMLEEIVEVLMEKQST